MAAESIEDEQEEQGPERPWVARLRKVRLLPGADTTAVAIAVLVGLLAGAGNLAFRSALDGAHYIFWHVIGGLLHAHLGDYDSRFWLIPLIPLLGGVCLVVLDKLFPGDIKGYGLPKFLELVNLRGGFLKRRWIALKTLSAAVTMGSGMSAGVEGPIVQIGGAIGSTVSRYLRTSAARLKVLIACGAGAAISATFGAPITGVVFAQEIVLLGEYQLRSFMLIVLSSASAMVFNHWVKANEASALVVRDYPWPYNHELLLYAVMGILLGLLALAYIRTVYGVRDRFEAWQIPEWLKPIIGGLMVGLIAVVLPWVTGNGYDTLNVLHRSEHWMGLLLIAIALGKMLATGITLGCGGSGGVFAPALVIGGTFGGGFAQIVNQIHPGSVAHPGTFVLVGMGALLGAATHAPLTSIFLLLELTGDYRVVLPIMFATVTAVLVARSFEPESIDTLELARKGIHIHEGHEANILKALHVGAFYSREFQPVPLSMPLSDFLHYLPGSRFTYFPVVDDHEKLAGVVTTQDVRDILFERDVWPLLVVGDVCTTGPLSSVTPRDTLHHAMSLFGRQGLEHLLVVDENDPRSVLGLLSRQAILDAYQKGIMAREIGEEGSGAEA